MPTLGEELRRRREERSIPLADISEATKIGTRFLKAIEADNYSTLPGGIFTRSFIRAYAKAVGMNEDEAVGLYQQQITGPSTDEVSQSPTSAEKTGKPEKTEKPEPRRAEPVVFRSASTRTSWPTIIIAAGIILFIAIIVIALVKNLNKASRESAASNPPAVQRNEAQTPAPTPEPTPDQTASTEPAAASQVPAGEPFVISLEAMGSDCWVRYQVDERKPNTLTVRPGMALDLPPAENQVKLNLGNTTALKFKINNREAKFPPDTPNFKAVVVISRDNIQAFLQ